MAQKCNLLRGLESYASHILVSGVVLFVENFTYLVGNVPHMRRICVPISCIFPVFSCIFLYFACIFLYICDAYASHMRRIFGSLGSFFGGDYSGKNSQFTHLTAYAQHMRRICDAYATPAYASYMQEMHMRRICVPRICDLYAGDAYACFFWFFWVVGGWHIFMIVE